MVTSHPHRSPASTPTNRSATTVAGIALIVAALVWLLGEAISASAFPGYSYATNYISDLGIPEVGSFEGRAIDSPLHALMNTVFIAQGILFGLAVVLIAISRRSSSRRALLPLAVAYTLGMILVGTVHGSQASVESGIAVLHVVGAGVAIITGNVIAIVIGLRAGQPRWYRWASIVLGIVGLLALIMLEVDSLTPGVTILPDGVWERGAVYTIVAWELLTGARIVARLRTRPGAGAPGRAW